MESSSHFRGLFLEAMRKTAATVSIVTTAAPGRTPMGVTVSSMCSLSADPCMVLVCVHHLSRAAAEIAQNGSFCVNVLPSDQAAIANCFADRSQDHHQRFKVGAWSTSRTGSPSLDYAIACLDCELEWFRQFATHFVFVGNVVDIAVRTGLPLVYSDRSYRQLSSAALS